MDDIRPALAISLLLGAIGLAGCAQPARPTASSGDGGTPIVTPPPAPGGSARVPGQRKPISATRRYDYSDTPSRTLSPTPDGSTTPWSPRGKVAFPPSRAAQPTSPTVSYDYSGTPIVTSPPMPGDSTVPWSPDGRVSSPPPYREGAGGVTAAPPRYSGSSPYVPVKPKPVSP